MVPTPYRASSCTAILLHISTLRTSSRSTKSSWTETPSAVTSLQTNRKSRELKMSLIRTSSMRYYTTSVLLLGAWQFMDINEISVFRRTCGHSPRGFSPSWATSRATDQLVREELDWRGLCVENPGKNMATRTRRRKYVVLTSTWTPEGELRSVQGKTAGMKRKMPPMIDSASFNAEPKM